MSAWDSDALWLQDRMLGEAATGAPMPDDDRPDPFDLDGIRCGLCRGDGCDRCQPRGGAR